MPPVKKPFHARAKTFLRAWRDFRKLSQEKAAGAADIDRTTLGRIEKGKAPYSQDILEKLAVAYQCSPADLISTEPGAPSRREADVIRSFRDALPELDRLLGELESPARNGPLAIPIMGRVGAGEVVTIEHDAAVLAENKSLTLPAETGALIVLGDSQSPRLREGEIVLYDRKPLAPAELVDELAIVELLEDGRRLIKQLRRGPGDGWSLESANPKTKTAKGVRLRAAYRVLGTLTGR
jgi:transcriptional regulator with XRE-family HTH domain